MPFYRSWHEVYAKERRSTIHVLYRPIWGINLFCPRSSFLKVLLLYKRDKHRTIRAYPLLYQLLFSWWTVIFAFGRNSSHPCILFSLKKDPGAGFEKGEMNLINGAWKLGIPYPWRENLNVFFFWDVLVMRMVLNGYVFLCQMKKKKRKVIVEQGSYLSRPKRIGSFFQSKGMLYPNVRSNLFI